MSRNSAAKKARRRKRQAARAVTWIPAPTVEDFGAAGDESGELGEAVAAIDDWLAARGWMLDVEHSSDVLVSWVYPPSAADFDDPDLEPVTRICITVEEDDEEVTLEFSAVLVGAGESDDSHALDAAGLADHVAAVEAYRPGLPRPLC